MFYLVKGLAKLVWRVSIRIFAIGLMMAAIMAAPDFHKSLLREYVGQKTFMITNGMGSGGTAFLVKAPSGKTYLLTNDHICVLSKTGHLFADNPYLQYTATILKRSDHTDLCLLSGPKNFTGLKVAKNVYLGQSVRVIGHPRLYPLTVSPIGEVVAIATGENFTRPLADGYCDVDSKKYRVYTEKGIKMCGFIVPQTYLTNTFAYRGNSGSAMVNFYGEVVGVVTGVNNINWGYAITLEEIELFLSDY